MFELSTLSQSNATTPWIVLLAVYGVLSLLLIGGIVWLCGTEHVSPTAPSVPDERPGPRRVRLHPLMLDRVDGSFVLDGVVRADDDGVLDGTPIALELVAPQDGLLASVMHDVLNRWVSRDDDLDLDLSKVHRTHPSVRLSSGDTHVRLDVVRLTPDITVRRDLGHAAA